MAGNRPKGAPGTAANPFSLDPEPGTAANPFSLDAEEGTVENPFSLDSEGEVSDTSGGPIMQAERVKAVAVRNFSSSNVEAFGYIPIIKRLFVWFLGKGGAAERCYYYDSVPQAKFDGMKAAASKGIYLNAEIKKAGYPFTALD